MIRKTATQIKHPLKRFIFHLSSFYFRPNISVHLSHAKAPFKSSSHASRMPIQLLFPDWKE